MWVNRHLNVWVKIQAKKMVKLREFFFEEAMVMLGETVVNNVITWQEAFNFQFNFCDVSVPAGVFPPAV